VAKRKTLFDDRPVEIAELTYIIKQDLSQLNSSISSLQALTRMQHPNSSSARNVNQEGEHAKTVVVLLQGKLADVSVNFKEVLETRTKNIQATRSRTENFVTSVAAQSAAGSGLAPNGMAGQTATGIDIRQTNSPLYATPVKSGSPLPSFRPSSASGAAHQTSDLLTLDPSASRGPPSQQQLMMLEEQQPQNSYIAARSEAIEAIERTISELGGIFSQLATMVTEQSEMIQRIDANTEDVVDNVQGAQKELLKYWSRVSSNRWLIAKMFGVLMVFFLLWVLVAG
jgi:syntaxin 5